MPDPIDFAFLDPLRSFRLENEPDPIIEIIDLFSRDGTKRLPRPA